MSINPNATKRSACLDYHALRRQAGNRDSLTAGVAGSGLQR